jgi:hypothetical protein
MAMSPELGLHIGDIPRGVMVLMVHEGIWRNLLVIFALA